MRAQSAPWGWCGGGLAYCLRRPIGWRATDPDPDRRFSSVEELADQLTGVLHEIAATTSDVAQPRMSTHFSPQREVYGVGRDALVKTGPVITALPVPVVDPGDPGAARLATTSGTTPAQLEHSLELRADLEMGDVKRARTRLSELEALIQGDWRLAWYGGQCALLEGRWSLRRLRAYDVHRWVLRGTRPSPRPVRPRRGSGG